MLRFLTAGSVDDGKSTLIGRLLYDSKMIYEDQFLTLQKDSKIFNKTAEGFTPALLTDGLKAEREQGITIDVAYRYFSTEKRSFIICDSPGHEQYTRNMATGASNCNLAIILIDARNGVMPQTKRHSFISSLLGIKHFIIAVNKMDSVGYAQEVFDEIKLSYEKFSAKLNVHDVQFIPISAINGDNVVNSSENMKWFKGAPLLSTLENIQIASDRNLIDFRFPVQYVLRPNLDFRGFAGTISSGIIRKGAEVKVSPSGQKTKIKSIITYDGELEEAFAPMSVTLTTIDEVDISRGCILSSPDNVPSTESCFDASIVWMYEKELVSGKSFLMKMSTQLIPSTISKIRYKFDINTLHRKKTNAFKLNDIGRVKITAHRPVCFDQYNRNQQTGSFILIDSLTNATVAAGMIIGLSPETQQDRSVVKNPVSQNLIRENSKVTLEMRRKLFRNKAVTVWLTGLSGSGKSTIAKALEFKLVSMGIPASILDGDNIRQGLNKDLDFSVEDRKENIRRISHVAKLMNSAGLIVITAFISPFLEDRSQARNLIGNENFIEVFVDADIDVCRKRDPKGLYKKVAKGKISNFTGIDSPYETPESPDIVLNTEKVNPNEAVELIISDLKKKI